MQRGFTGRYEVSTTSGEAVRAFVPAPLPPDPPLEMTGARQLMLERAVLACGRLDGVAALLPDPDLFLYAYVRREALLSSQIEGTQSTLSDLLLFELDELPGVPFDDVVEVSSYVAALEHGLARLRAGLPISSRLIREVHGRLMAHGRGAEKQPGDFRRSQNWIGGTRPGNARFVPPPPGLVPQCITELEQFLHAAAPQPALVTAALAHVQFETIHPFLDGNGRAGRLLIALILHDAGVLKQPLLYLSLHFKQHRDEYYRLLDQVRTTGDWEAWLDFFLEGVHATASAAVETAHRLLALFREDEARLHAGRRKASAGVMQAFKALRERPVTRLQELAVRANVAFATAAKAMDVLVAEGIARELTGGRRNRVFAYERYVQILNEGAEPLGT